METLKNDIAYVVNEISLVYNRTFTLSDRPVVNSAKRAADLLREFWDLDKIDLQEQFRILLLSPSGLLLGTYECSTGGISMTIADPRLIFTCALKANARSIIIAHNHPSGNLKPSEADIKLTRKLIEGGKLLEIVIADHIIITSEGYLSLAEEGLL